jgi:hypothetical protein
VIKSDYTNCFELRSPAVTVGDSEVNVKLHSRVEHRDGGDEANQEENFNYCGDLRSLLRDK